jgi:hypothetical protein
LMSSLMASGKNNANNNRIKIHIRCKRNIL